MIPSDQEITLYTIRCAPLLKRLVLLNMSWAVGIFETNTPANRRGATYTIYLSDHGKTPQAGIWSLGDPCLTKKVREPARWSLYLPLAEFFSGTQLSFTTWHRSVDRHWIPFWHFQYHEVTLSCSFFVDTWALGGSLTNICRPFKIYLVSFFLFMWSI